jgi:hypothetical protein
MLRLNPGWDMDIQHGDGADGADTDMADGVDGADITGKIFYQSN